MDGRRLLIGEVQWTSRPIPAASLRFRPSVPPVPGIGDPEIVPVVFAPRVAAPSVEGGVHVVDAGTVFAVLR